MKLNRARVEQAVRGVRDTSLPIRDSLKHYASPYYDPVKAKEYYERTKELKGRNPPMSQTQKEVFNVSKYNISEERKKSVETADATHKEKLDQLRAKSKEAVTALTLKLNNQLKGQESTLELNPIPRTATPQQRAFLTKQNNRIKAKAKRDNQEARKKLADSIRSELADLQEAYKKQREEFQKRYEDALKTEEENIRKQVE